AFATAFEDPPEERSRLFSLEEDIVLGDLLVLEARRHHHAFDAHIVQHREQPMVFLRLVTAEERRVRADAVASLAELADRLDRNVVYALALDGNVVRFLQAIEVDDER